MTNMSTYRVTESDVEAYDRRRLERKMFAVYIWFVGTEEEAAILEQSIQGEEKLTDFSYSQSIDSLVKYLLGLKDPFEVALMIANLRKYLLIIDASGLRMEDRGELPEEERSALCSSLNLQ
jgi:hypothetical protein